jgi:hypothetical protein
MLEKAKMAKELGKVAIQLSNRHLIEVCVLTNVYSGPIIAEPYQ